jgi:hypothetical protein
LKVSEKIKTILEIYIQACSKSPMIKQKRKERKKKEKGI